MNVNSKEVVMNLDIIKEYFCKCTKENVKKIDFAFNQAEKDLDSTVEVSNALESKIKQLIVFLVAILTVSIGTFCTAYFDICSALHSIGILTSLGVFILLTLTLAIQLTKVFRARNYYTIGNLPEDILLNANINLTSYQLKVIEITSYNKYININRNNNCEKADLLKDVYHRLLVIIYYPLAVLMFFAVVF